jgi:hypothetical protein
MDFLKAGVTLQAAATPMLELGQKAIIQHFDYLRQGSELSQKFFAKSLEVDTSSGLVGFALDYCEEVHRLASELVRGQVTLAGEVARVARQSLVQPEAVPAASAADTEKVVAGSYIAEPQEGSPKKVGVVNALREMAVAPARAHSKSQPKKD